MDLQNVQTIAVSAAKEAGDLLKTGLREQKTIAKKSSAVDLQTQYDNAAEALIIERLRTAYPDHRIVAEEGSQDKDSDKNNNLTWYIDPLDGTNNFVHGFPVFAVSIALYESGSPLFGVIYDPTRDECFSAIAGQGAFLSTGQDYFNLRASNTESLVESLLATGFPYDRHDSLDDNMAQTSAFLKRVLGIRRAGSAALDLAYVAAGRLDGFWEFKLSSWDAAAGILLVKEAGGRVSQINGEPFHIAPVISIVASNNLIHTSMLEVLLQISK